jgi:hypothetical protein
VQYFGLAPRAVLSKATGVVVKRVLVPLFAGLHRRGLSPAPEQAIHLQDRFRNFLRYRAGSFMPRIGPQTLMVVAQPIENGTLN